MPNSITLDTFRASVQNYKEGDNSFVRMSRSKEGQLTKYCTGSFFETHRNFASDDEIAVVREQFYQALSREGVAGSALEQIRNQFGLDRNGKFNSQVHNDLSCREVKAVLQMADGFAVSREAFALQLEKEGYRDAAVKAFIANRLGLDNPATAKMPCTEDDKKAFMVELKKECRRLFDAKAQEVGMPNADTLVIMTNDIDFMNKVMKKINDERNNYKGGNVGPLRGDVNKMLAEKRMAVWQEKATEKVAELSAKYRDCSVMVASLMKKAKDSVIEAARKLSGPMEDFQRMDAIFDAFLDKFIKKATPMLDRIASVQPPFGEEQIEALRNMVFTEAKFRNPAHVDLYSKNREMLQPLLELSLKPNPTMDEFMKIYSNVQRSFDMQLKELQDLDPGYGGDDMFMTYDQTFALALAVFKDKHHSEPVVSEGVRNLFERYKGELKYLGEHLDDGVLPQNPLKYTHKDADYVVYCQAQNLKAYASYLGMEELSAVEDVHGLSPAVVDFLGDYGILSNDPRNKPLDCELGQNFQTFLLEQLNRIFTIPQNVDELEPEELLDKSLRDLTRSGTSWKLGGEFVARSYDFEGKGLSQRCMEFFDKDKLNGRKAACLLGNLLNQSMFGTIEVIRKTKGILFAKDKVISSTNNDFAVNRNEDGSYDIRFNFIGKVQSLYDLVDGKAVVYPLDQTRSELRYDIHLTLSFDDKGKQHFAFAETPTMKGGFYASTLTNDETQLLQNLKDPETGDNIGEYAFYDPSIIHDAYLLELLKAKNTPKIVDLLKSNTLTKRHAQQLENMGLPPSLAEHLLKRMLPAERYLDRLLMNRLTDRDREVRLQAAVELKEACRPYIEKEWCEDFDINVDAPLEE